MEQEEDGGAKMLEDKKVDKVCEGRGGMRGEREYKKVKERYESG